MTWTNLALVGAIVAVGMIVVPAFMLASIVVAELLMLVVGVG